MSINYREIFKEIKEELSKLDTDSKTGIITNAISEYFGNKFNNSYVAGYGNNQEYLYDIAILNFDPLNIKGNDSLDLIAAIESELGGTSATGFSSVDKNVIYDFIKILISNASYKIMIGTYSSKKHEENTLQNKLENMTKIAHKTNNIVEVLVIMIKGSHTTGNSRQIKLNLSEISGFIISNGCYFEIL